MTDWVIEPVDAARGQVEIRVPGDKSISHRAILFNTLAVLENGGAARVVNLLDAEDVMRTVVACEQLGAQVVRRGDAWEVSRGATRDGPLDVDCGNSGTTARLLLGAVAGRGRPARLAGDASLSRRPMGRVIEPLAAMGARFSAAEGQRLPLVVTPAALCGVTWTSKVASAQVKSAVLLAGLLAEGATVYTEPSPSRDHTERLLTRMGAPLQVDGCTSTIRAGTLRPVDVDVPGDISSAAFWMVAAGVLGVAVTLPDVGLNPTRSGCLEVLAAMGLQVDVAGGGGDAPGSVAVQGSLTRGATIGGALVPRLVDELPVLAIAAAFTHGETVITDAEELRVKESDRIAVVVNGLQAMGVEAYATPGGMRIVGRGGEGVRAAVVESHGDHRIAMAFAIAGLRCGMRVRDVDCVATSYRGFLEQLRDLSPRSRAMSTDAP